MLRDDFLLRQIQQIAQLAARLLGKRRDEQQVVDTMANADPPDPLGPDALDAVEEAYGSLLGFPPGLIDFIDARGAAELVRRDGLPALIDLLDLDAEVARRAGRPERAARRQRLAMQLRERTLDEKR
jgi:hypothetical protein